MLAAITMAQKGMESNAGGPFGAVIVRNNELISSANNEVTSTCDPTAHAEVVAIRKACLKLGTFQLDDCILYTSCEPCPMCLGAIYWARPKAVYYACLKDDAAAINFDDRFIYTEIDKPMHQREIPFIPLLRENALKVFEAWSNKEDRIAY